MRWARLIGTLLTMLTGMAGARAEAAPFALCESVWTDLARARDVPVRVRMPVGKNKVGVILFSHGLGGSLDAGSIWANAWAEAGYAVINVQHHGSDSAIFGKPGFRSALSAEQLVARVRDVQFVITEMEKRTIEGECDLARIDRRRIGMAGHSFGAQTVQALAGQRFAETYTPPLHDPRIRAAIGFSPSPPLRGSAEAAFATIRIPFLSITGTTDAVPYVTPITALQRQQPFKLMPPGAKYLLVFQGGTHEMFAGQSLATILNGEPTPHIRQAVIAITVAYWRAMLDGDQAAFDWLQGPFVERSVLDEADRFEKR